MLFEVFGWTRSEQDYTKDHAIAQSFANIFPLPKSPNFRIEDKAKPLFPNYILKMCVSTHYPIGKLFLSLNIVQIYPFFNI